MYNQDKMIQRKYTTTHHQLILHLGRHTELVNTIEIRLHTRPGHMQYTHTISIQPWHER